MTVDQTSGISTCTDVVSIGTLNTPSTDSTATSTPPNGVDPMVLAALLVGSLVVAGLPLRRQRSTPA